MYQSRFTINTIFLATTTVNTRDVIVTRVVFVCTMCVCYYYGTIFVVDILSQPLVNEFKGFVGLSRVQNARQLKWINPEKTALDEQHI